jgi:hypothetical protein
MSARCDREDGIQARGFRGFGRQNLPRYSTMSVQPKNSPSRKRNWEARFRPDSEAGDPERMARNWPGGRELRRISRVTVASGFAIR